MKVRDVIRNKNYLKYLPDPAAVESQWLTPQEIVYDLTAYQERPLPNAVWIRSYGGDYFYRNDIGDMTLIEHERLIERYMASEGYGIDSGGYGEVPNDGASYHVVRRD